MRTRSLRTRLVAITLLLLAAASAVVAVITVLTLRSYLVQRLDEDLLTAGRAVARAEAPPGVPDPARPAGGGPPPLDALAAELSDGRVLFAVAFTRSGSVEEVPQDERAELLAVTPGAPPRSVDLGGLGTYRVVASQRPDGSVLVTGLPEGPVQATVQRLVTTELVVTAVALLGAGLVGAVVVRREMRPLERVAATASRVTALPLDRGEVSLVERVPGADPRTEVGKVSAALNHMLDHVGAALEARQDSEVQLRQFVADASHELRTPLAAIRGYAELSRRSALPAEAEYSLVRISSQAERMTALVEDLLLLARLDAGRPLERADVDLTRLVLDAVNDAHVAGPRHRWSLDLPEEPVVVTGDASRLTQVVTNLLANARTHTPPGTAVTVALAPEPGGGARVSVVDAGPGIPPALLPHVFERFARGSTSRAREGDGAGASTGLGLAIVDAVVAAHGGSVAVESRPGRTAFTVHLPGPTAPRPLPVPSGAAAR